jgi:Raf kinase inhibitor-like YbhB/YbcL family protein
MKISSPAFEDGGEIPRGHSCDGEDTSPALHWTGIPDGVESLALIVDDPDAPAGTWVHWLIWNLDPAAPGLPVGVGPGASGSGAVQGANSWGNARWQGPCPPGGTHRYFFRLYALDRTLDLAEGAARAELERAMDGNVVATAELMGHYGRGR